jgi:hypothetical protein
MAVNQSEIAGLLFSGRTVWLDISRDGISISGKPLDELRYGAIEDRDFA